MIGLGNFAINCEGKGLVKPVYVEQFHVIKSKRDLNFITRSVAVTTLAPRQLQFINLPSLVK